MFKYLFRQWWLMALVSLVISPAESESIPTSTEKFDNCATVQINPNAANFTGKIDREAVIKVLENNSKAMQICLCDTKLNERKTMKIELGIDGTGSVDQAKIIESNVNDRQKNCLVSHLKNLSFPKAETLETTVTVPIVFIPKIKELKGKKIAR